VTGGQFVAGVREWTNTQLALVIAYGVDLTAITILMYNIAPKDITMWAFFAMGYLLVTVKLTAIRKKWLVAWAIAALVNVFTTTSFFVTTGAPEHERPAPLYVVAAQETFQKTEAEYTTFQTGKAAAIEANRLTLLRDQYNPAATEAMALRLSTDRRSLTEAKQRALLEPVTGLEVFGRVPRLLATTADFATISFICFWLFASIFIELVLFYLKGGRFRQPKVETIEADETQVVEPATVPTDLTATPVYPRQNDGSLVPPMIAAPQMNVSFDVALALYSEERKKENDPQISAQKG